MLLLQSPLKLDYVSDYGPHGGDVARLAVQIAQTQIAATTALLFLSCAFYSKEVSLGLDLRSVMHENISMDLPPAVLANIDELSWLHTVSRARSSAATSSVLLERLRDLDGLSMGVASSAGWIHYRYVASTVFIGVNCLLVELVWQDRS